MVLQSIAHYCNPVPPIEGLLKPTLLSTFSYIRGFIGSFLDKVCEYDESSVNLLILYGDSPSLINKFELLEHIELWNSLIHL